MFLELASTHPAFYWIFWIGIVITGLGILYFSYGMYRATHNQGWFYFLLTAVAGALALIFGMTLSDEIPTVYKQAFMICFAAAALIEAIMLPRALYRLSKEYEATLLKPKRVILPVITIGLILLIYNIAITRPITPAIIASLVILLLGISRFLSVPYIGKLHQKDPTMSWSMIYIFLLITSVCLIALPYLGGCCADEGPIKTYATCNTVTGSIAYSMPQFCPAPVPQLYVPFLWILFVGQFVGMLALYVFWTNLGDDLL